MILRFLLSCHLYIFCCPVLLAEPLRATVVGYNVRYAASEDHGVRSWASRKNKVTNYLLKKHASILGLQEVLHSQLVDVKSALPGYRCVGVGRDDGKKQGEYSPIFYDSRIWRADPDEQGTFWLSDSPEIPGSKSWGNDTTRICTWVRLTHLQGGRSIYVFNTHWDHLSEKSRDFAALLMIKRVGTRKHPVEPFIIMGDFNTTIESRALKTLLESKEYPLHDHAKHPFITFNQWQSGLRPGYPIDHILFSKQWKRVSHRVEENGSSPASDHHPIVATGEF